jgi:hypothetical protein
MSEYQRAIDDTLTIIESYKYGEYSAVSDDAPEDSMEVLRAKAVESTVEGIMGELRELRKPEEKPATTIEFEDPHKDRVNRALVVQYQGRQLAVLYSANSWMRELLSGMGADSGFYATEMNLESDLPDEDGVYVVDLVEVDYGPGDYPGTRETTVALRHPRRATKEEWVDHCLGMWPWDVTERRT